MARIIVLVLGFVGTVGVSVNAVAQEGKRPTDPAAQAALRYFESIRVTDFETLLRQLRLPAPPPSVRARVIKNLPVEGILRPTTQEAAKLEALLPVLAFHEREHDIELRLGTAGGLAVVGLYARTVLLITREALLLLDTNELLAIGAHELGHEYVWDDYEEAQREGNAKRLQELELRCDGFAVITMAALRVAPERLVSAATKLARHNERKFGEPIDERYVPLDQRIRFTRCIAKLTGARRGH
jgi:Zn-dependent protease with chaperone function